MSEEAPPGGLVFVDGRDALCAVIVVPLPDGGVRIDASANGISKEDGAAILRQVADRWDPDHTATPIEGEWEEQG